MRYAAAILTALLAPPLLASVCDPAAFDCDPESGNCRTPTPTVSWEPTPDALSYDLFVREPGGAWLSCDHTLYVPVQRWCDPPGGAPGTEYEVGVSAVNQAGAGPVTTATDLFTGESRWCWPEWWECDTSGCEGVLADGAPAPPPAPAEIIVDNGDPGTATTDAWQVRSDVTAFNGAYLHARWQDSGFAYTWNVPDLPDGTYRVDVRWISQSNRAMDEYAVYDGGGLLASVPVDQTIGGGVWHTLGFFTFTGGGRVEYLNTSGSGSVDAVRFTP